MDGTQVFTARRFLLHVTCWRPGEGKEQTQTQGKGSQGTEPESTNWDETTKRLAQFSELGNSNLRKRVTKKFKRNHKVQTRTKRTKRNTECSKRGKPNPREETTKHTNSTVCVPSLQDS
jgi:hypothetical protein